MLPFHNEKTPSFVVSPSKGFFKCFGCGKAATAVTFVMEHENMTWLEALKYVAKKYGIEVAEREQTPEEQRRNDDRESMMVVSSYAADYFVRSLHDTPEGAASGSPISASADSRTRRSASSDSATARPRATRSLGRRSPTATKSSSSSAPA